MTIQTDKDRLNIFLAQAMCELTGTRAYVELESVADVATGGTRITMVVTFPQPVVDDGDVPYDAPC